MYSSVVAPLQTLKLTLGGEYTKGSFATARPESKFATPRRRSARFSPPDENERPKAGEAFSRRMLRRLEQHRTRRAKFFPLDALARHRQGHK